MKLLDFLEKCNINYVPVLGVSKYSNNKSTAFNYDNVQYCISTDDYRDEKHLLNMMSHLTLLIKRHHDLIKFIYDHYKTNFPYLGDIWVMAGGGSQVQACFGNSDGFISILYLDMECVSYGEWYIKKNKSKQYVISAHYADTNNLNIELKGKRPELIVAEA